MSGERLHLMWIQSALMGKRSCFLVLNSIAELVIFNVGLGYKYVKTNERIVQTNETKV